MKCIIYFCCGVLLSCFFTFNCNAFHIVGGEMTYECVGGSNYQVKLIVYRDCLGGGAEYDDPAYLFVFSGSVIVNVESLPFPGAQLVAPPTDICIETLPDICVEKATYTTTLYLPPTATSYTLVYQRYSRNATLVNIVGPAETGSTYSTVIPGSGLASCNTSAEFNNLPPTVICADVPFSISQSASDADGDSLAYSLCNPLIGGNEFCFQPGNPDPGACESGLPPSVPPYPPVTWLSPYSTANPMGGDPPLNINPITGLLTVTPTTMGQFVAAICVTEYRNGVAINTIRRDFQFNVTSCLSVAASVQAEEVLDDGTFVITDCGNDFTVDFINTTVGADNYYWDFGDETTTADWSTSFSPSYAFPDSGQYVITLIASAGLQSCGDTATVLLNLYPTLTNDFSYEINCAGDPVAFTDLSETTYGNIDSWLWTFATFANDNTQNPSYTFEVGGDYPISLLTTTSLGCSESISESIWIPPLPVVNFETTLKCPGLPIDFQDLSTILQGSELPTLTEWQWNFGDPFAAPADNVSNQQNPMHTYTVADDYTATLMVTSSEGCTDSYSLDFTIYPAFLATASGGAEICAGQSIGLSATDEFDWFTYEWSSPETLDDPYSQIPVATPTETTEYAVTVSDPNGCTDIATTLVTVNPLPTVNSTDDTTICYGETLTLMASFDADVVVFAWSGGGLSNATDLQVEVTPEVSTTYFLTVVDNRGCENVDSTVVTVVQPVVSSVTNGAEFCEGESVQLGASGGVFYQWSPVTGLTDANIADPIASPEETTEYIVLVSNECYDGSPNSIFADTDTVLVTVNPLPFVAAGVNLTLNVGETATLNGEVDMVATTYTWSPTAGLSDSTALNPIAQPLATTTYALTAVSDKGCENTDSITITVTNIFEVLIPNAFSPNNDGINDGFGIENYRGLRDLLAFRIYNRWGNLVFETTDFTARWDGSFKGEPAEMGVYVYYIQATTFLEEPFLHKGNVSLIK